MPASSAAPTAARPRRGEPTVGRDRPGAGVGGEPEIDRPDLTEDERVLAYETDNLRVSEVQDPDSELRDWFPRDPEAYATAMRALGLVPVIDL